MKPTLSWPLKRKRHSKSHQPKYPIAAVVRQESESENVRQTQTYENGLTQTQKVSQTDSLTQTQTQEVSQPDHVAGPDIDDLVNSFGKWGLRHEYQTKE